MTLKVIGPGLGRTGTNSLKLALEQLGFGPCHHMYEVRDNPERLADWQAAARGEAMDWPVVFRGYNAQVDWPGARYWRELTTQYPEAKVVLTVRDPDDWFDSVHRTIAPMLNARGTLGSDFINALSEMAYQTIEVPVFANRLDDRAYAIGVFNAHIAQVQAEIPKERLLTFDVRQGWTPLCDFLGVAAPDNPFPKTNSSKQFGEEAWKRNRQEDAS